MRKFFIIVLFLFFIFSIMLTASSELEPVDWEGFEEFFFSDFVGPLFGTNLNPFISQIKINQLDSSLANEDHLGNVPESILSAINSLAIENSSILNSNENIKKAWFSSMGIEDLGAQVLDYDGLFITTEGEDSTTFLFGEDFFEGAKVFPSGKLILSDGSEVSGSKIYKGADYENFVFQGGIVNLNPSSEMSFKVKGGLVEFNEKGYFGDFEVNKFSEDFSLIGEKVTERFEGKDFAEFTGLLRFDSLGKILGENTEYTIFSGEEVLESYLVEKDTYFFTESGNCKDNLEISCIERIVSLLNEEDFHSVSINAVGDNLINFNFLEEGVDQLNVGAIKDSSKVIASQEEVEFEFGNFPLKSKGDYRRLNSELNSFFVDSNGKEGKISIKEGKVIFCSGPCSEFSSLIEPQLRDLKSSENRAEYEKIFREKYGGAVHSWYPDFLVYQGNPKIYNDVVYASQKIYEESGVYISPDFLYVGAVAEGLDLQIVRGGGLYPKEEIDGFYALGLDTFGTNAKVMRNLGYLPKDFVQEEKYKVSVHHNELGEEVNSGVFSNFREAFVAKASEYAWRRDAFLKKDVSDLGLSWEALSQDEVDFWTYVYYNAGIGTGKKMLTSYKNKGYLESEEYLYKKPNEFWDLPYLFANRRLVNLKAIQDTLSF